jgi:uncharacterized membrane protein YjdF
MAKRGDGLVLLGFIIALLGFGSIFWIQKNYEFINYQITIIFYAIAVYFLNRKYNIPTSILAGSAILAVMHMLGGVNFGNGLVYGQMIYPLGEQYLRYDQIIHAFGTFVIALFFHHLLRKQLKYDGILPHVIIALCALGVGAYVEITEFMVALNVAENHVGDYVNFALDLVADFVGAGVAMILLYFKEAYDGTRRRR